MKKVAEFYKVSFNQFKTDYEAIFGNTKSEEELKEMYESIKLPKRATTGSAGYDFFLPFPIELKAGEEITIPTGIRFKCKQDWAMLFMSKSGLGSKSRLQLNTAISLIDSDYYYSDNEGHILSKIIHDTRKPDEILSLPAGKSYLQGLFIQFGITYSDKAKGKRNGGFGSTK